MSPVHDKNEHLTTDQGHDGTSTSDVTSPGKGPILLQQAVLKTLQNVSTDTLTSFLSPTTNTLKVVLKSDKQLVIWRKGLEVFVSAFAF